MDPLSYALSEFKKSLCTNIEVGGLSVRNHTVHKWKAPWRSILLREVVAWRVQDLLEQSHTLHQRSAVLGARILLRSAFETLAVLIYLNRSMRAVVMGGKDFHVFSDTTTKLLLGSKDKSTSFESINILTILQKAGQQYPGLEELYAALSESAHPNYEGMMGGYSRSDPEKFFTTFENRWSDLYGARHRDIAMACLEAFVHEYDNEWPEAFEALEQWIETNDAILEATKPSRAQQK